MVMRTHLIRWLLGALALLTCACALADDAVVAIVEEPFVDVHTGPGRGYPVFHVVERGAELAVLARRTDWFRVRDAGGVVGWVPLARVEGMRRSDGSALVDRRDAADAWRDRRFELTAGLGDFEGSDVLSLQLGARLAPTLTAELTVRDIKGRFSDARMLGGAIVHEPFPYWRASPSPPLGSGVLQTRPRASLADARERVDQVATVGGGLRFRLGPRFLLRAQFDHHLVLTDRNENEEVNEWKLGFAFFF